MTPLKKPVVRLSCANGVNRKRYVVTIAPGDLIGFRDVRTRTTFWLPLSQCYSLAVRAETMRRARERAAKRAARSTARR